MGKGVSSSAVVPLIAVLLGVTACGSSMSSADTSLPPLTPVSTVSTVSSEPAGAPATAPSMAVAAPTTSVLTGTVTLVPPASYPDGMWAPTHTPGSVLVVTTEQICASGYTKTIGLVSDAERQEVLSEYGVTSATGYVIDHLVSVDLGGSNNLDNLWPESTDESKRKDSVDNGLHDAVCKGQMSLADAQEQIATWWTAPSYPSGTPAPAAATASHAASASTSASTCGAGTHSTTAHRQNACPSH